MSKGRSKSVGVVKTKYFEIPQLELESGKKLSKVRIAYETYGRPNRDKTNAILICHALSGDAHAAGRHRVNSRKSGWYDIAIGPGKTIDTKRYFVISSNVLGGCGGSTGPSSINPKAGRPYGMGFPEITIGDMVCAQKKLTDHLGIKRLFAVIGGSMGGMQALKWSIDYPDSVKNTLVLASGAKQHPLGIVFHHLGRQAITRDPSWNRGRYKDQPRGGLSLARQISHITYLSEDTLARKFGRRPIGGRRNSGVFGFDFDVQAYFDYKGKSFARRFDANSYLYITSAIDRFDLTEGGKKELSEVFGDVKSKFQLISFKSDWLYTPEHMQELYSGLAEAGVRCSYRMLDLPYGHDSFLVYNNTLGNVMTRYLDRHWMSESKG